MRGRAVSARRRLAVSMRASAIVFCTVVPSRSRKTRSTSVRERPARAKTSQAERFLPAFSAIQSRTSGSHSGAPGQQSVEARAATPRGATSVRGGSAPSGASSICARARAAARPTSTLSLSMLESCGEEKRHCSGSSSTPSTATSRGTEKPAARHRRESCAARRSSQQNTATGFGRDRSQARSAAASGVSTSLSPRR